MKYILSFVFVLFFAFGQAQITLTHNIGNTPIKTDMVSCETTAQSWSRTFTLSDFGISKRHKFIVNSGQVAIYNSLGNASLQFFIYKIDDNFPNSFSKTDLIGSSQTVKIPVIGDVPEIVQVNFDIPIVIPDGIDRVLVQVIKLYDVNVSDDPHIAGTVQDNDISWYWGCHTVYAHTQTENLSPPSENANFYINITGELSDTKDLGFQTKLTHNFCDDVIKVRQYSCSWGGLKYARTFVLEDFNVSDNEEFIIDRGQVAFSSVGVYDVKIQFNIYKIDDNFPDSYSESDLIGSSQIVYVPNFGSNPKIFDIHFGTPIIVPSDVDKILVEVFNLHSVSSAGLAFIAGGAQSNDISWLRSEAGGCPPYKEYKPITNPDINYFINVSGKTNHVTNNFEMNISNICSEFLKEFSVENKNNVASVVWNFGDLDSGVDNTSTDVSPFHDFSSDGEYTITATVIGNDGSVEVLTETIDVKEPPNVYGIDNIYACEDNFGAGISSSFDVATVEQQILGGQTDKEVKYIDGYGNEYDELPNLFTNTIKDRETITVQVAHSNNPCCVSETSFDLIVNPLPDITSVDDLEVCDDDKDGFALFNLQQIKNTIIGVETNKQIEFYYENGQQIPEPLETVKNAITNEEVITARAINTDTDCYNETLFKLIVQQLPVANILDDIIGCDDNNDGVSEYFDTSNVDAQVLGSQTDMNVSFFDSSGNPLPSPLPNPYGNSIVNQEIITVRVTNLVSDCYSETTLVLNTASQPQINEPETLYSCDLGNGFSNFDTSNIETELVGNQNGLEIMYFDANGTALSNPLPNSFKNTEAWNQTIYVRVENKLNSLCYNETSFDLIVNDLPSVIIEETYFLCNLEPSLYISTVSGFDSYKWEYQDGNIVSNTYESNLINAGDYTLTVGENLNGIYCENSFNFELIRSVLPTITDVNYKELSDDNYIEIIASGDGDFEYSIDGMAYQNSHVFNDISGGIYTAFVRDKFGCGEDSQEVTVIDYPKYFTPNNDGVNDTWQIKGIKNYPNARVLIYDRYGKLLKQISPNSIGWDGTYNGENMLTSDYWFVVILNNENEFRGHFSLKR